MLEDSPSLRQSITISESSFLKAHVCFYKLCHFLKLGDIDIHGHISDKQHYALYRPVLIKIKMHPTTTALAVQSTIYRAN